VFGTLAELPNWLVTGTLAGLALSVLVAAVFAVGRRRYPDPNPTTRPGSEAGAASGDSRRRTEIRQYLTAIGEPFAEDHPVGAHTVAFYLPERDVAITFDARAFYDITTGRTEAVLVEHEMPGMHLGSRLPFETPDIEFGDDDEGNDADLDRGEAAFAVLGLPSTASEAEVRDAYREKVKTVHPDHGGDPEEFQRVKEAYAAAQERVAT
jgi:hypothetical protein